MRCGKFQSTPAIAGERTLRGEDRFIRYYEVSIHARHYWRANQAHNYALATGTSFQSTPAIAGERTDWNLTDWLVPGGFNPRPPLLASEPAKRKGIAGG